MENLGADIRWSSNSGQPERIPTKPECERIESAVRVLSIFAFLNANEFPGKVIVHITQEASLIVQAI